MDRESEGEVTHKHGRWLAPFKLCTLSLENKKTKKDTESFILNFFFEIWKNGNGFFSVVVIWDLTKFQRKIGDTSLEFSVDF